METIPCSLYARPYSKRSGWLDFDQFTFSRTQLADTHFKPRTVIDSIASYKPCPHGNRQRCTDFALPTGILVLLSGRSFASCYGLYGATDVTCYIRFQFRLNVSVPCRVAYAVSLSVWWLVHIPREARSGRCLVIMSTGERTTTVPACLPRMLVLALYCSP